MYVSLCWSRELTEHSRSSRQRRNAIATLDDTPVYRTSQRDRPRRGGSRPEGPRSCKPSAMSRRSSSQPRVVGSYSLDAAAGVVPRVRSRNNTPATVLGVGSHVDALCSGPRLPVRRLLTSNAPATPGTGHSIPSCGQDGKGTWFRLDSRRRARPLARASNECW